MIRINLLPAELHVSERKVDPIHVIGAWSGILGFFLIVVYFVQFTQRNKLKTDIAALSSELDRYKPIVAQVEQLARDKAQLQQRKGIIQTLENERLRYPYFMEDFLKLIPSNVWLTNLTTTMPPDGSSITVGLDVIALDHYAVADMVSNLETSQIFFDVDLGPITLSQSQTGQSITFHVNTTYRKGATPHANQKS